MNKRLNQWRLGRVSSSMFSETTKVNSSPDQRRIRYGRCFLGKISRERVFVLLRRLRILT